MPFSVFLSKILRNLCRFSWKGCLSQVLVRSLTSHNFFSSPEYIWLANQCSFVPKTTYFFGRTKVKGSCKKKIHFSANKSQLLEQRAVYVTGPIRLKVRLNTFEQLRFTSLIILRFNPSRIGLDQRMSKLTLLTKNVLFFRAIDFWSPHAHPHPPHNKSSGPSPTKGLVFHKYFFTQGY